jgi:integrase
MAKTKRTRPTKPYPDFPLFPHATGRWAKKIRGKFCYFGKVATDPKGQAALEQWLEQKDDLLAGRVPRPKVNGVTIRDLANRYLSAKRDLMENRELDPRTFAEMYACCERIGKAFGWDRLITDIVADDFDGLRRQLAKRWGVERLAVEIKRVRSLFRYAFDSGLIDIPVRYGAAFRPPSARVLRVARSQRGPRMFEAAELRRIIAAAKQPLGAMVLVGINCGFGNSDCATLPKSALDLKGGWVNFPRGKTGVNRRCPLWPETVAAIRQALEARPTPKSNQDRGLVFLTPTGLRWVATAVSEPAEGAPLKVHQSNLVAIRFRRLLRSLKLRRHGLGFYGLRHTFETIGGDSRDQVAVDHIMGHARNDMASVYRERIDDDRLVAVTEHVRAWLFGEQETK